MAAGASTALPDGLESKFATLHTLEGHTKDVNGVAAFTLPDGTPRPLRLGRQVGARVGPHRRHRAAHA